MWLFLTYKMTFHLIWNIHQSGCWFGSPGLLSPVTVFYINYINRFPNVKLYIRVIKDSVVKWSFSFALFSFLVFYLGFLYEYSQMKQFCARFLIIVSTSLWGHCLISLQACLYLCLRKLSQFLSSLIVRYFWNSPLVPFHLVLFLKINHWLF